MFLYRGGEELCFVASLFSHCSFLLGGVEFSLVRMDVFSLSFLLTESWVFWL